MYKVCSGDVSKKKLVTVAWKKVCPTYDEGGLGLRSLVTLNLATNLKFCWEMMHIDEQWAQVLRSRVVRDHGCIHYHVTSTKNPF